MSGQWRAGIDYGSAEDLVGLLEKENKALRVLARRVHAECGPANLSHGRFPLITCRTCKVSARTDTSGMINHDPNCLWLAAEAVLKKAQSGEGKP